MIDSRLGSLIRAIKPLDDPDVSRVQIESVRALCHVLAESLLGSIRASLPPDGFVAPPVDGWPDLTGADPVLAAAYELALAATGYIHSFAYVDMDYSFARRFRRDALTRWAETRRAAETLAFGAVSDTTTAALTAAETRMAEGASKETPKPLAPQDDGIKAWSF